MAPTKYNETRRRAILNAIEQGVPYRHAAAIAGISQDTFERWRARYAAFAEEIKAAEGRAVAGRLARIRMAETDHWQAAAWWLERKYPQEFGRTIQDGTVRQIGGGRSPLPDMRQFTDDEVDQLAAIAERITQEPSDADRVVP